MPDTTPKDSVTGPLSGYRIIEFAANLAGPVAGMWLGDQGADVIKVESATGDQQRNANATRIGVKGMSSVFATCNRNKKSIVLDIKQPESVQIFKDLVKTADVVFQNFRPGVMERMGLGYEDLKKVKPDIIMVSISGFGAEGPYSKQRAYDTVVQAASGVTYSQRDIATGEPALVRTSMVDKVTAFTAFQAITAALLTREKTGKGQLVEINMLQSIIAFLWPDNMSNNTWTGDNIQLAGTPTDVRLIFKTKDHYVVVIAIADGEWKALCTAIGKERLIEDPRFKDIRARLGNFKAQYEELKDAFLHKTSEEWLKILTEHDCVCGPVNELDNLHLDPHIAATGMIVETEHPYGGTYRQPIPAANFRGTPASIRIHAPMLGEQTEDILRELGRSEADISSLKAKGAIQS